MLCKSICQLQQQHKDKIYKAGSYQTSCSMKKKSQIVKLVGDKCIIECNVNNVSIPVLMDTGAQVSIIEEKMLQEQFPDVKIRSVSEL